MGDIEHSIKTAEVATWCEGCGPHENLGTCSECGHPVEAGVHPDLASQLRGAVEALRLIVQHARLDYAERGIGETYRYALLAEDAIDRFGGQ